MFQVTSNIKIYPVVKESIRSPYSLLGSVLQIIFAGSELWGENNNIAGYLLKFYTENISQISRICFVNLFFYFLRNVYDEGWEFWILVSVVSSVFYYTEGYPQIMRRLYWILLPVSLHSWFTATVKWKLVCFFAKSLNKSLDYYIWGRILNLTQRSSYFKSFRSSLLSHLLCVTL